MPESNGFQFLDWIESNKPILIMLPKIFLLSSTIDQKRKKAMSNSIVSGFYSKPISQIDFDLISEYTLK